MYVAVTTQAVGPGVSAAVRRIVSRFDMAGLAQLPFGLFEQLIVFAPVRVMAFNTTATIGHVCVSRTMFVQIRPRLIGMTALAG